MENTLTLEDQQITPPEDPSTNLTLIDKDTPSPVQGTIALNRAAKNHLAMGTASPGVDAIENMITTGQETYLQQIAAAAKTEEGKQAVLQHVKSLALRGNIKPEEAYGAALAARKVVNVDPSTVLEKSFADTYTNLLIQHDPAPDGVVGQALQEDPEGTKREVTGAVKIQTGREILQRGLEDAAAKYQGQSWGEFGWNLGKTMVGLSGVAISPDWNPVNLAATGQVLSEDRDTFWGLMANDPGQAKAWYQDRLNTIAASNPVAAVTWAEKMKEMSRQEQSMMNISAIMDTQMVGSAAASIGKVGLAVLGVRKLLGDGAKAVADGTLKMDKVYASVGDLAKSAEMRATKEIFNQADPLGHAMDLNDKLPTLMNIDIKFAGPNAGNLSRERAQGLVAALKESSSEMMDVIMKVPRGERTPESALRPMLEKATEDMILQRPSINDAILDTRIVRQPNTNTRFAEAIIGTKEGTLFRSAAAADKYAQDVLKLPYDVAKVSNEVPEHLIVAQRAREIQASLVKPAPKTFKTAKGSTYEINADGTTTRNKAPRPEHPGDSGLQKKSLKTVYLTKEQAEALNPPTGNKETQWRIADHGDGTLSTITRTVEETWGISPSAKNIAYETRPREGLIPLELWNHKILQKQPTYGKIHFGNEITQVGVATKGAREIAPKASAPQEKLNKIVQQGNGYYISITKPLNETDDAARALQVVTGNQNPVNTANWWLGGLFRSAEDQVSYFQRGNRHIVLHAPQEVQRVLSEFAQRIGTLKDKEALRAVLIANRDYVDYATNDRGRAFRTQAQLDKAFLANPSAKRLPTDQESLAYFTYHQIMDLDWLMRNFGVHRDLSRQGIEHYSIPVMGNDVKFPGRFEREIPWKSKDDFGILLVDDDGPKHYWAKQLGAGSKDALDRMIAEDGYRAIRVANPEDRPFKPFAGTGNEVDIVLTKQHEVKPLTMNLVDYSPGVHVSYPQEFFSKQPVIEHSQSAAAKGMQVHFTDKTIFAHNTEKEAIRASQAMDDLRKMFLNNASDIVLNNHIDKNLPRDLAFWKEQFYGRNGQEPYLSLDQPIGHTFSGKDFFDTHPRPEGLRSTRSSEHNLFRSIDMGFLANRNGPLETFVKGGTAENPIYHLQPAEVLDPFVAINRGVGNALRNVFLNDYKIGAIEQWARQYAPVMKDAERALKNPFEAFYGQQYNEAHTDRELLASAKNTRDRIVQFLGTKSELGKDIHQMQNRLMSKLGEEQGTIYHDIADLGIVKDPIAFTRSAMFEARFGFFNPGQFPIQAMGAAHAVFIAGPEHGWKAMAAYTLQRWMLHTEEPAVINRMANIASKFGWDKKEFLESFEAMKNSGIPIIGKEHALRNESFDPNLFQSKVQTALDMGKIPFTEGERLTRMVAWNAAWSEFRKANPNKVMDNYDMGKILVRMDDLSANMTKASNSAIQEGLFSIPSQFMTFTHRMMEQFWGGRLTGAEKARAFVGHSILFGVPITASIGFLYPFYEELRQKMLESGSPLINNTAAKLALDGFLSYAVYHITGKEYNIQQRYGPGAPELIKKFLDGELTAIEAFGGPTGGFVKDMVKSVYPFYAGLTSGPESFPLGKEDFWSVARNISAINNDHNGFYAVSAHKYFSKAGNLVADGLDWKDGIAMVMGLMPKQITDARLIVASLKDQADAQKKLQGLAATEIKRSLQAFGDDDDKKGEAHYVRAMTYMQMFGDFTDAMVAETYKQATTDMTPLVDRINLKFTQKGNKSQHPARLQRLMEKKNAQ